MSIELRQDLPEKKSILNDILASFYDFEVSNIDLQCSSFDGHLLQSFGPKMMVSISDIFDM